MPPTTDISKFQSFLILCPKEARLSQRQLLARNLGLDLGTNSPDTTYIVAQKHESAMGNPSISIQQIRGLKRHIFQRPVRSKWKLIVVVDANKLTIQAQNALLKILEEPPKHAILILEAENEFQLLQTIVSRVFTVKIVEKQQKTLNGSFLDNNLLTNLQQAGSAELATNYLDDQIKSLYITLLESIKTKNELAQKKAKNTILMCVASKKMIAANVNPRFVLANLFLTFQT